MERTRRRPVWAVCAAVVVAAAVLSLLWTDTASTQIAPQGWRCYPAKQSKGQTKFAPVDLILNGALQFNTDTQALKPIFYCDPVNQGLNATASPSLICYSIKDAKGTPKFSGATVEVSDFALPLNGTLDVKKSKFFCSMAFGVPVL